jgi:hypothetical protein
MVDGSAQDLEQFDVSRIDLDDVLVLWLGHPREQESVVCGSMENPFDHHGAPSWRLSVRD